MALAGQSSEYRTCWEESGVTVGAREAHPWGPASHDRGLRDFALLQAQFDRFDWLDKILCAADMHRVKSKGWRGGFVSTQDTSWVDDELTLLEVAHNFGMRLIQLTYSRQNRFGCGCTERRDGGLSDLGARLVRRMNELGIIVDTSHCGPQTTVDACKRSRLPVVASHTSAASVCAHDRAKSDRELRAIAATGGVIGIYALPPFLSRDAAPTIDDLLDHVDYVADLVGVDHVSLGTDWPLQAPKWTLTEITPTLAYAGGFRPEHRIHDEVNLIGFDDYRDYPNITRGLVARAYSDAQIRNILGENVIRVFRDVCG
jgi:membrane dipeptidase